MNQELLEHYKVNKLTRDILRQAKYDPLRTQHRIHEDYDAERLLKSVLSYPAAIFLHETNHKEIDYGSFIDFAKQHCRFVTVTFQRDPYSEAEAQKQFGRLYFNNSRRLIGKKLNEHIIDQPIALAFSDYAATRCWQKVDLKAKEHGHIHSIFILKPHRQKILTKFDTSIKDTANTLCRSVRSIDVQSFDPNAAPIDYLAWYCMKGYAKTSKQWVGRNDIWTVYPAISGNAWKEALALR